MGELVSAVIMVTALAFASFTAGFFVACDYWCDHPRRKRSRR
jgi:hypothetical protein